MENNNDPVCEGDENMGANSLKSDQQAVLHRQQVTRETNIAGGNSSEDEHGSDQESSATRSTLAGPFVPFEHVTLDSLDNASNATSHYPGENSTVCDPDDVIENSDTSDFSGDYLVAPRHQESVYDSGSSERPNDVVVNSGENHGVPDTDLGYEDDFCEDLDETTMTEVQEDIGEVVDETVGDDMERYVEENRHLLEQNEDVPMDLLEQLEQTSLGDDENQDDLGDFIETDIPQISNDDASSDAGSSSARSSFENLPAAAELVGENVADGNDSGEESGEANDVIGWTSSSPSPQEDEEDQHPRLPALSHNSEQESYPPQASGNSVYPNTNPLSAANETNDTLCEILPGHPDDARTDATTSDEMHNVYESPASSILHCRYCNANRQSLKTWNRSQMQEIPLCDRNCNENLSDDNITTQNCRQCNLHGSVDNSQGLHNGLVVNRAARCEFLPNINHLHCNGTSTSQQNNLDTSSRTAHTEQCPHDNSVLQYNMPNVTSPPTRHMGQNSNCDVGSLHSLRHNSLRTSSDVRDNCLDFKHKHLVLNNLDSSTNNHSPHHSNSLSKQSQQQTRHSPDNIPQQRHIASASTTNDNHSLSRSFSVELTQEQGLADLYDPSCVNIQWLHHMTRSLDEEFLASVLGHSGQSSSRDKKNEERLSTSLVMSGNPSQRQHLHLYTRFLKEYLLSQLQDPHRSWWYQPTHDEQERIPRAMVWSEFQTYCYSLDQISDADSALTAAANVLRALDVNFDVSSLIKHLQRDRETDRASLYEYLQHRAAAGSTAEQLIEAVEAVTQGHVTARFFHCFPQRAVCVREWLAHWIKQGAVAMVTLNLQHSTSSQERAGAWHHQMVYGVSPKGVYLTNPQQLVSEAVIGQQLCCKSELLIGRQEVLSHVTPDTDLSPLMFCSDIRWQEMNVLGQVVHLLRESNRSTLTQSPLTSSPPTHIVIPTMHRPGITLFSRSDSSISAVISNAPDLPTTSAQPRRTFKETEIF